MMGYPIQKRGCHLCIAEDADPFAELQICCDDNAGLLIELADQMEQQQAELRHKEQMLEAAAFIQEQKKYNHKCN